LVEDKSEAHLWYLKYSHNWAWQLEIPEDISSERTEEVEGRKKARSWELEAGNWKSSGKASTANYWLCVWKQIAKLVNCLDEPLGEGNA
jgi:hypothetical protein